MRVCLLINTECVVWDMCPGDVYHVDAEVAAGLLNVTAWSVQEPIALRVSCGDVIEEQFGRIACVSLHLQQTESLSVVVTLGRRQLTTSDSDCAAQLLIALKDFATGIENGAKESEELALAICTTVHQS